MAHLQIHLPYEACVGGLVQNRWTYPFERVMVNLKRKVKNRSYVEGSICEAYSFDEISIFVSDYFLDEVLIKANRVPRHDDGGNVELHGRLSAFGLPGRAYGKGKRIFLSEEELHAAHTYILFNCEEIDDFVRSYDDKLKANQSGITDKDIQLSRDLNFALWLKDKALNDVSIPSNVQVQAMGPDRDQVCRNGYKVNGYDFHTKTYAVRKRQLTLECVFKEIVTMSMVVPFTGSWRKSMSCRTRMMVMNLHMMFKMILNRTRIFIKLCLLHQHQKSAAWVGVRIISRRPRLIRMSGFSFRCDLIPTATLFAELAYFSDYVGEHTSRPQGCSLGRISENV
ncbi:hypothetical protein MRB53_026659 [Persea americana]|uniref:Uncharacterized protein n=1 Tax=Persea americana TaxID=3435 RepID=A0ACC2LIZ2_PERAE|nr:hypothetical protein MRB53_026659 [Persea americana]